MPTVTRRPKTKCYIHEMRSPLEPAFDPRKYQICSICQARLLEMAKTNLRFALNDQIVTLSTANKDVKESAKRISCKVIAT